MGTVSDSAWSQALDACKFGPEEMSPDSFARGREHAAWDICIHLFLVSAKTLPPPPYTPLMSAFFANTLLQILQNTSSACNSIASLMIASLRCIFICFFPCFLCLSALYPVEEGFRHEPSSVSSKVAPQPAVQPTRGPSLLGPATQTFAPRLPQLRHLTLATVSQPLARV